MKIQMQLKDIVQHDIIVEQLGLNPYCVNEGADPESWHAVEVENVIAGQK